MTGCASCWSIKALKLGYERDQHKIMVSTQIRLTQVQYAVLCGVFCQRGACALIEISHSSLYYIHIEDANEGRANGSTNATLRITLLCVFLGRKGIQVASSSARLWSPHYNEIRLHFSLN